MFYAAITVGIIGGSLLIFAAQEGVVGDLVFATFLASLILLGILAISLL